MADLVLETQRLVLRAVGEDDVEDHNLLINTEAVMAHLGGVMERHEIEARHAKSMALYARHGFSFLFMFEKTTGEMVGYAGIKLVDNPLAPNVGDHEIGWTVRQDRWRRGYAFEAVRGILDWAFGPVGAPHVAALTSQSNIASWKLMEKLGMQRREDLDFDDPDYPPQDNPTIQYLLNAADWRGGHG